LPDTKYSDDRLTRYAALALKTEACLYEGTFRKYHGLGDYEPILREAVNAAEDVINSGIFSLYSTGNPSEDFVKRFIQEDLTGNSETILASRRIENLNMNNRTRKITTGNKKSGYSKDFMETYLCTDGLPISTSPLYQGDAKFDDQFINRDPRMRQSVYYSDDIWLIWDDGEVEKRDMPLFINKTNPTSFYYKKYRAQYISQTAQNKNTFDDFLFRYSELLVSYAEAKAELGECTQEVLDKSINLLRDRVDMIHLTVDVEADPSQNWEVPVTPLIHEIRRERRIELCIEGKRFDDLVRWKL